MSMSLLGRARRGAHQAARQVPDVVPGIDAATRFLAFLWAAGGAISLLVVALPHPAAVKVPVFAAIGVVAFSMAAFLRVADHRLPP
jgi:hypothetical protein